MPNILARLDQPVTVEGVITQTTTPIQLHERQNGTTVVFNSTTSMIANLPPPRKGLWFQFYVKVAATSGVGHLIHSSSAAKTFAKGFSEAVGKGAVNTQASGAKGDSFYVVSDGTDWYGIASAGTWAREA